MRRAELLETHVRRVTENTRTGSTGGISSEDFFQFFTDAQLCVQRRVMMANKKAFRKTTTWSADGSESYDYPSDIFGQAVISLEYSSSGNAQDYRPLEKRTDKEALSVSSAEPSFYIPGETGVTVNPYPATGTFRMRYARAFPRVDKRRGTVSTHTKNSTALSALTLTGFTAGDSLLSDHLSAVDFNGTQKMIGIPYTQVASGVVSIYGSTYTFPTGSTMSNGDYICLGANASTHLSLPDFCEDFVLLYCAKRIFQRDSSTDALDADPDIARMLQEIVAHYADPTGDVDEVVILNQDYALDY